MARQHIVLRRSHKVAETGPRRVTATVQFTWDAHISGPDTAGRLADKDIFRKAEKAFLQTLYNEIRPELSECNNVLAMKFEVAEDTTAEEIAKAAAEQYDTYRKHRYTH